MTQPFPRTKWLLCALFSLGFQLSLVVVSGDDLYIDHSYKCPIQAEAPVWGLCDALCVENVTTDCPSEMACPTNTTLCGDGYCYATDEECTQGLEANGDPCGDLCGVSCPIVLSNFTDLCSDMFPDLYEASSTGFCADAEIISYHKPGFVFAICWVAIVGGIALLWCFCNQRLFARGRPYALNQENTLEDDKVLDHAEGTAEVLPLRTRQSHIVTQTGYKTSYLGLFLYALVIATLLGFQISLCILCVFYYYNEYGLTNNKRMLALPNSIQALKVYEITWHIGVVWSLILKWPPSIIMLFRRRCNLSQAEFVNVFEEQVLVQVTNSSSLERMKWVVDMLLSLGNKFCSLIFSDVTRPSVPGVVTVCPVIVQEDGSRYFYYKLKKFNYNAKTDRFDSPRLRITTETLRSLAAMKVGLSSDEAKTRFLEDGANILAIPRPTPWGVLFEEFRKPFYLYQNFMAWTWFNFYYWHMGIVNTLVYVGGGLSISFVNFKNRKMIYELATVKGDCEVLRDGQVKRMDTTKLVAGDVIVVRPGPVFCDFVLLQGQLLLDESSLTGESMPVAKVPIEEFGSAQYSTKTHKKSTVLTGTTVLESDDHTDDALKLGLVMCTGANSSKGTHLRKILLDPPPQFKFDIQVKVVILILLAEAIAGFVITLKFLDTDPVSGWFYAMYVVATALPPLLPTVFVVSVGIGSSRLRERQVLCSDPNRILMAGKVRVACFDKTGTLTRPGLDFHGVVRAVREGSVVRLTQLETSVFDSEPTLLTQAMASCHSLSKVGEQLIGNSVDVKMFESTGWKLGMNVDTGDRVTHRTSNTSLTLVRRFDFDHGLCTMSAFAFSPETSAYHVFLKGSAESVKLRCVPASLPADYDKIAEHYARAGCYVLALASRAATQQEIDLLKAKEQIERESVETNMNFVGFITFKNELKHDSAQALQLLRDGDVRTLIVSGDHPLTTMHIARQCNVIRQSHSLIWAKNVRDGGGVEWLTEDDEPADLPEFDDPSTHTTELAVTGDVFHALMADGSIHRLLQHIRVFARMSPEDKVAVVQLYIARGFITSMCGDGGNDCGALRVAHVGVALSDAEASVVSPFTGLNRSCMSVVDVLLEGRSSLASSFSSYRYMIMYGQVETINQIINAYFSITFYEWCWVFMDGIWMVTLAFTLPFAYRATKLSDSRPPSSLLGTFTMTSCLGVLAINFGFLCLALGVLNETEWYSCRKWVPGAISDVRLIGDNYESSVIFLVSGAQYITSAMAFNFGLKFRAPWLFNWRFVILCVCYLTVHFVVIMVPSKLSCIFRVNCEAEHIVRGATTPELIPIQNTINTTLMPVEFRRALIGIIVGNMVAIMAWEYFIVNGVVGRWVRSRHRQTARLLV
eukprot:c12832_g1_i1.p1 GENE.c12832_g1_i1~~c12832_g1_i1.p1  ORF type:complete len:1368 (+),score=403.79 c12832_g1_i1:102-4205(+)